jgi:hypothetical protein
VRTVLAHTCPHCGRPAEELSLTCGLCGNVLRREREQRLGSPGAAPVAGGESAAQSFSFRTGEAAEPESSRAKLEPWLYLGIGLASAPVFAWTPILQYMGWFLASLVHEMGHAGFAWLCGMPAVPAISLGGHAAAVHGEQSVLLALLIAAGIGTAAWQALAGRARWIALASVAALYPLVAFSGAKELLHLLAGHGAEIAFATLCLWKALDGGFTNSRLERALHGTLGWYLLGKNASLCWGLMHSARARSHYRTNGSFGLTNDYIRVAEDVLGCRLPTVAFGMLALCVLVFPAAWALWRLSSRARRDG